MSAAALTLLVYEYCTYILARTVKDRDWTSVITLNDEVTFVWRRPGRSFKVLWALVSCELVTNE